MAKLQETLLPALEGDVLELDELWSYVGNKKNQVWIHLALCRRTRQIVAWMPGDHTSYVAAQLWGKVPQAYKRCLAYADGWAAYAGAVPPQQLHQQEKKGPTNHLERFNLTLRQRVGRLTRKTLSFSKCPLMHIIHIRSFLIQHNQLQAQIYLKSTAA
jgi:IS1 family transposase